MALVLFVPFLVWLGFTIRQPDGKAILKRRVARAEELIRSAVRHTLGSTAAWANFVSVVGVAVSLQPFTPVAELIVLGAADIPTLLTAVYPYKLVFGVAPAIVFSLVLLFHIAFPSGVRTSVPIARAMLLFIAGIMVLLVTTVLMAQIAHYGTTDDK